jgi:tRNA nucleotidyltransferase/poly(A) polymerase
MKTYLVGGAVRDLLLGLTPKDRDYVVVGSTEAEMLANGFTRVGASFPVFLKNGEEYALARKERKTGVGYKGFDVVFDPSVTLEEDLFRRDLTINSMAMDLDTGEVIDPFGGRHDLAQGVLRATSDAFAEDPVRVLRTARFAARYGFTIAQDTLDMMRRVSVELNHVPGERIWAEFEKGLQEQYPGKMLEALERSDAMWVDVLNPYRGWSTHLREVADHDSLEVRFALLARGFNEADYERCKIPTHLARVSKSVNKYLGFVVDYVTLGAIARLTLLMELRAMNDSVHLNDVLKTALHYVQPDNVTELCHAINADVNAAKTIDAAAIAKANPSRIGDAIFEARLRAIS